MVTSFRQRDFNLFDKRVLRPVENYVGNLYSSGRPVEALYLSGKVVSLAVRLGVLRNLLNALRDTTAYDGLVNPIQTVASIALDITQSSHAGIAALPAAASIIGLGRYLELDIDLYTTPKSDKSFRQLTRTAYEEGRRQAANGSPYIASGLLAAAARLAALDNDQALQQRMLVELDGGIEANLPAKSTNLYSAPVAQAATFARKYGDADTAVAFGLISDPAGPSLLSGTVVPYGDPTYSTATRYLEAGNTGVAGLLFDAAIDNASTPKIEIAKILQPNRTAVGRVDGGYTTYSPGEFFGNDPTDGRWKEDRTAIDIGDPAVKPSRMTSAPSSTGEVHPALPRTLNAWIGTDTPVERQPFHVEVMIGNVATKTEVSARFAEPDWGSIDRLDLLITLSGFGCDIEPAEHRIVLPKTGNSPRVKFTVTPDAQGPLRLSIRVNLAKQLILLQSQDFTVEVAASTIGVSAA